ncbi:MAG: hypothetical protein GF309_05040 [Candidatus Lokiarchaeota archaeon]|nr:hypothetical protein [Candidatus Lokiarchaeota archaeon]
MTRAIHAKRFVMIFSILTLFIITGMTSTAVAQLSQEEPEPPMAVAEYVMKCYDGKGFAAEPGAVSDLETTLDAAKLLMENPDSWPVGMGIALDTIVEQYAEMQSPYRGGFVTEGENGPAFRTTALIVETLDILDMLDAIDIGIAKQYLQSSFRGSLTLNKWLTEGDFYTKYWALRTANTLECVNLLGLHDINLNKIIAPDANRADFPEVEPYLVWNQPLFEQGSRYGSPFKDMDYEKQLDVVETLDMIIGKDSLNPTVMPLLLDVDSFTAKVAQRFDRNSGLFVNDDGDADLALSREAVEALRGTGTLQDLFDDGMGARRLVNARQNLDTLMEAWTIDGINGVARTTDLVNMKEIKAGLQTADEPELVFTPQIEAVDEEGETGIAGWDRTQIREVFVPDTLIESLNSQNGAETSQDSGIGSIIVLVTLISMTVVTAGAGKKKLAIILSLLCVLLFMGQYAYGIDAVTRDAARFLGSTTRNKQDNELIGNTGMLSIGTRWLDLEAAEYEVETDETDKFANSPVETPAEPAVFKSYNLEGPRLDDIDLAKFAELRDHLDLKEGTLDFEKPNGEIERSSLAEFAHAFLESSGIKDAVGSIKGTKQLLESKLKKWLKEGYVTDERAAGLILTKYKKELNLEKGDSIKHVAVKVDDAGDIVLKDKDDFHNIFVIIEEGKGGGLTEEIEQLTKNEHYRVVSFHPSKFLEKVRGTLEDFVEEEKGLQNLPMEITGNVDKAARLMATTSARGLSSDGFHRCINIRLPS